MSFLQQGGSSLFCNPSKQNHDFQGSRASIFQCFFPIFSTFHSGPHFSGFFGDFRVAKAPVLELVGLIFRHQKKESKKGLRVYASIRDAGGGVPTSNQDSWVSATKLQDFRTASYQLAKLTSDCKTADCKTRLTYIDCMLLVIISYASQPGGPRGAGGYPKHAGWLAGWLAGRLAGRRWPACQLAGWLALVGWPASWAGRLDCYAGRRILFIIGIF